VSYDVPEIDESNRVLFFDYMRRRLCNKCRCSSDGCRHCCFDSADNLKEAFLNGDINLDDYIDWEN
jgi:hypothetical protein